MNWTIHQGDLFDVLPTLEAESVDAGVTDPPYGIGFMGREWDTFKPEQAAKKQGLRQINKSDMWSEREERKAAKRQINPNLKGRTVDGAISSSQIEYDYSTAGLRSFQDWTQRWAAEVIRVLKPGAYIVVCGAPRSYHRMACGLEDAGFVVRDCFAWLFGSGFPKNKNLGEGRGTALKPAHEPIALAWKPFKGSIAANVEKWGTGALNIEACRIGDTVETWPKTASRSRHDTGSPVRVPVGPNTPPPPGRWPANVLLDEEAAAVLDEQTGELVSGGGDKGNSEGSRAFFGRDTGQGFSHSYVPSIGGASRFYYVAKPSREERDQGCDSLPEQVADAYGEHRGRRMDEPSRIDGKPLARGRNIHPTVKPVELMRWLVRLVTPPGGLVLDPFLGSGTTGMAAIYEQRRFIGIEREAEYLAIADRRIRSVAPLFASEQPA